MKILSDNKQLLKTVDAETLLATPLKPIRFVVDQLIPQGLHILAGSPKIGKSWLMLQLCLQVSKGEPLWEYDTNKCDVLYLCLEDTYNRVQNRMFHISDEASSNLHFAIAAKLIDNGLKEQIENFISLHPDTGLVVIDTFQRIRGMSFNTNAYANDYCDTALLKSIADKHGIALIVVHHLRKNTADDPVMMISGSTGISGGVDCNYVLVRDKRSVDTAKLVVSGRDTEYQEITIKFEHCTWQFISCEKSEDIAKRETPAIIFQLVEFMKIQSDWIGNATELLTAMGNSDTPYNTVTKLINQFHNSVLAENCITYAYRRDGGKRYISLKYKADCDSYDSNDSYIPIEKQLSQPSQLSPKDIEDIAQSENILLETEKECKSKILCDENCRNLTKHSASPRQGTQDFACKV